MRRRGSRRSTRSITMRSVASAYEWVDVAWYRTYTGSNHGYGFVAEDVPELSIAVIASRRHERIGLGRTGRRRPTRRRRHLSGAGEGGLGRATGERLCRQRGRLSPRYTGSAAKPLPNPIEGYDQDEVATRDGEDASQDPESSPTNKEDSICRRKSLGMSFKLMEWDRTCSGQKWR